MVLVDSPAVDGPDGPAVQPVEVADDTDGAAEVPPLPLPEVPPESSSPSMLRNPAAERQLSPSKARLTQRAAEASAPQLEAGEEGDGEGEVGEDERQEGEGAGDAEAEAAVEAAEEVVVAPPSPSKMRRFSLPQLSAEGGLPKWNQFYTEESVNQRVQLMQHPKVKHALDQLWMAANFNAEDEIIDKEEYLMMHRKIVLALEPGTYPLEALAVASEDWVRDSEGKKGLDRERFLWSWFELADLWTESMEAEEYEQFLTSMMALLTREVRDEDGTLRAVWREDKDVIKVRVRVRVRVKASVR